MEEEVGLASEQKGKQKPRFVKLRDALTAAAKMEMERNKQASPKIVDYKDDNESSENRLSSRMNNSSLSWQWEDLLRNRSIRRLLRKGRIRVDDCLATCAHMKLSPASTVYIDDQAVIRPTVASIPRVVVYHKRCGVITTLQDNMGRPDLSRAMEQVAESLSLPSTAMEAMKPVGRLDMHSRGLLLWTSDGRLARALTASNSGIPRRYVCVVRGPSLLSLTGLTTMESRQTNVEGKALQNQIAEGVVTPYGTYHAQLDAASPIGTQEELDQVHSKILREVIDSKNKISREGDEDRFWWPHLACRQQSLNGDCELTGAGRTGCGGERSDNPLDISLEEKNDDNEGPNFCCYSRVTVVVQEGKKREVRRLLRHCGYFVCDLYRTAFGPISLKSTPEGTARVATLVELEWADEIIARYESSKKS